MRVGDPLKGWTRQDAALTDTFSIKQATVDVTGFGLQFVQMGQPAPTAQIFRVVYHGLDAQRAPVFQILLDARVPVEGVDIDLGAVGDDLGLVLPARLGAATLAAFEDQLDQFRAADVEVVGHQGFEEPPGVAGCVEYQGA